MIAYLSQLFAPLRELGTRVGQPAEGAGERGAGLRILDEHPESRGAPRREAARAGQGAFSFRDVTFAYDPDGP